MSSIAPNSLPNFPRTLPSQAVDPLSGRPFRELYSDTPLPAYVIVIAKLSSSEYQFYDWAHYNSRKPKVDPSTQLEIVNTYVYAVIRFAQIGEEIKPQAFGEQTFRPFPPSAAQIMAQFAKMQAIYQHFLDEEALVAAAELKKNIDALQQEGADALVKKFWQYGLPGLNYLREDRDELRKDLDITKNLWRKLEWDEWGQAWQ